MTKEQAQSIVDSNYYDFKKTDIIELIKNEKIFLGCYDLNNTDSLFATLWGVCKNEKDKQHYNDYTCQNFLLQVMDKFYFLNDFAKATQIILAYQILNDYNGEQKLQELFCLKKL